MNFSELIARRYSVRSYRALPIEAEKLQCVLEAARLAPTAANRQPFRIYVIRTAGRADDLKRIYHKAWFSQAPLVLCVCGLPGQAWVRGDGQSYLAVDVAIVMDHLTLAAADLGLGTCWIADFNAAAARKVLALPVGVEPVIFSPLGYPADQLSPKNRKPLSDLVSYM